MKPLRSRAIIQRIPSDENDSGNPFVTTQSILLIPGFGLLMIAPFCLLPAGLGMMGMRADAVPPVRAQKNEKTISVPGTR
jgi:hypothetical protein